VSERWWILKEAEGALRQEKKREKKRREQARERGRCAISSSLLFSALEVRKEVRLAKLYSYQQVSEGLPREEKESKRTIFLGGTRRRRSVPGMLWMLDKVRMAVTPLLTGNGSLLLRLWFRHRVEVR
jgi:hypothetical protein